MTMATFSHSPLTFIILTITLVAQSPLLSATPLLFNRIFAFGDSFTDTGNTVSATGPSGFNYVSSPPYGTTFFHRPTNRYTDGRLVIDFVASVLSIHFLPPYRHLNRTSSSGGINDTKNVGAAGGSISNESTSGVNFAVGGSTAIEYRFYKKHNMTFDITPESLGTQLKWFHEYAKGRGCEGGRAEGDRCMRLFDDALFWVGEIGANDYAYSAFGSVRNSTVQQLVIKRITSFLEELLQKYAKYIVVQGLPPTGCLTLTMAVAPSDDRDNLGCVKSANQMGQSHNALLQAKLQLFRKKYPHTVILYADYWSSYASVIRNPRKHGFTEPFKACCGTGGGKYNFAPFEACGSPSATKCADPSKYINWDGVHLTEAMYRVVADQFLHWNYTHPSFDYLLVRRKNHRNHRHHIGY